MKTIGIIGGMSYESSIHYYQRINDQVNARAGGLTCAELIIYNVNFGVIREHMLNGRWDEIGTELSRIAKVLEDAGADCVAIATNTMHKLADRVQSNIGVPLIHIADCVAAKCKAAGVSKVALLGTRYTMEQNFLSDRLRANGLEVAVPARAEQIAEIDRVIFDELCKGEVKDSSRDYFLSVIAEMEKDFGIGGVILGCTEIEMLIKQKDLSLPVFDTTQAHIDSLVDIALK
ncbi:MAG: aspartate/glutamate racemase family protein [Oscillospiraceae bacterium]|nr:aspartate/glutamate racemase family protein [Oscillospiraceae bacterium]